MPYKEDGSDTPKNVPQNKRKKFSSVFNSVFSESKDEGKAMAAAYAAIKKAGRRHSQKDIDMMKQVIELLQDVIGENKPDEEINKSSKLMDIIMLVERAFSEQFNLREEYKGPDEVAEDGQYMPSKYWMYATEIWDDFVIVCIGTPDGEKHYRVNYSVDGENVTFDGLESWQEVERVWQPKVQKRAVVEIGKSDDEKHLVYGVVLKPDPFVDSQGDVMTKEEIEVAAHGFMQKSRLYDLFHVKNLTKQAVVPVESYIAPQDLSWGDKIIPEGSWVVVSHVADTDIWNKIKKGKINAYSIKGIGYRKEIE
jgi:hypothetical protein